MWKAVITGTGMHDHATLTSNSTFVPQGSTSTGDGIRAIEFQGGTPSDAEVLINTKRNTSKNHSRAVTLI